ncbi:MAG: decaprenyl-phosphate phosphoribosyltransferase [Myxococcales bacterium]|nr:decaprenyl-phosphate phosphoribosyltransferase [Myxococcales bacterium]
MTPPATAGTWVALWRTARPHQWVKNAFVAVPLVFAGPELHATGRLDTTVALRTLAAVVAFCFASSAVYGLNDLADATADRQHAVKRLRPIAAGTLPVAMARRGVGAALVLAALLGVPAGPAFLGWLGVYFTVNLAYSGGLKRIAWVDAGMVASGFLLRVVAGGEAAGVHLSFWLIACTGLLALYLALGKRKHELLTSTDNHRAALATYRTGHLNQALGLLAAITVLTYLGYTLDETTVDRFHTRLLPWTVPFAVFGLWQYAMLLEDVDTAHSPTERMLRSVPFLANLAAWGVAVVAILYSQLGGGR